MENGVSMMDFSEPLLRVFWPKMQSSKEERCPDTTSVDNWCGWQKYIEYKKKTVQNAGNYVNDVQEMTVLADGRSTLLV